METLQILGWIYLGIILGCMGGVIGLGLFQVNRVADLRATIKDLQDEVDKYTSNKNYNYFRN